MLVFTCIPCMVVCDHKIKYCNMSTKKGISMKTKIRDVFRKQQNLWRGKSLKIRKEKLLLQNIKNQVGSHTVCFVNVYILFLFCGNWN